MIKSLEIPKIEQGTVLDHIPSEHTMRIAEILSDKFRGAVTIGINFESKKLKKKGILKLADVTLGDKDVSRIAILAREGTLNIIKDGKVIKKGPLKIPDQVEEILRCPNANCITNFQEIVTKFNVLSKSPLQIRCYFCERVFGADELILA